MRKVVLAAIAAAAAAGQAHAQTKSCEDLALEITALTAGAVSTASRTQELAQKAQGPGMLEQTMKAQLLGTVLGAVPGAGAGAAATVLNMADRAVEEKREGERAAAGREMESLQQGQLQGLERLLALHEEHEARCAAAGS